MQRLSRDVTHPVTDTLGNQGDRLRANVTLKRGGGATDSDSVAHVYRNLRERGDSR